MARLRTAVLISGRGSNLAALADAAADPAYPAEIVLVLSNNPVAAGLEKAKTMGLASAIVDHRAFADRPTFEAALQTYFERARVELVCLAGFMRLFSAGFVERWRDRMINIHPSLLPAFPGLDTHARALSAGARFAGCTVHFVRFETDTGPIIAQAAVAIEPGDTPETLSARVLAAEHRLYPLALRLLAEGKVTVKGETIWIDAPSPQGAVLISPLPGPGDLH